MENNNQDKNIANQIKNNVEIQVGYRFLPTDNELITEYLEKKIKNELSSDPSSNNIDIREVDFYKEEPEELTDKSPKVQEEEDWYFFTSRQRKYPNGGRPDRSTPKGYWKPTGKDIDIEQLDGTKKIGSKRSLDYYQGHQPGGIKTDWKMHEYILKTDETDHPANPNPNQNINITPHDSMKLDGWVLCRIYRKRNSANNRDHDENNHHPQEAEALNLEGQVQQASPEILLVEEPHHHQHHQHNQHHHQSVSSRADQGFLSDAIRPWVRNGDYDHNNQMVLLPTDELIPNINIENYGWFGDNQFLQDVVGRPWR